tara:strand:+ start:463 stop:588 length:126 start_codon:yes stop_codon:yes gene_type:complete
MTIILNKEATTPEKATNEATNVTSYITPEPGEFKSNLLLIP